MRKVAFYLKNEGFTNIDTRFILEGNPGIGGSEYEILCIASLLSMRNNDIEVILYVEKEGVFPEIKYKVVGDLDMCTHDCINNNVEVLILDYKLHEKSIIDKTSKSLNYFIWAHNFINYKDLKYFAAQKNVIRIVHVGKESLDLYRDHVSFYKSIYINNGVAIKDIDSYLETNNFVEKRKENVVYVGSLIEAKGFHLLAKAWKTIVKEVPSAQLYVIGNGRLYNKNSKLGKYDLAEESYEKVFINDLLEDGRIMTSVHFLGTLGAEKDEVLKSCKVGVPNPSGVSETFGISAVEMQLLGCRITTIRCPGYINTVYSSNLLYTKKSQLAKSVIKLLKIKNNDENYLEVYQFINDNFSFINVIKKWEFQLLNFEEKVIINKSIENNFHLKKSKEFLRNLKYILPFTNIIPPVERMLNLIKKINDKF